METVSAPMLARTHPAIFWVFERVTKLAAMGEAITSITSTPASMTAWTRSERCCSKQVIKRVLAERREPFMPAGRLAYTSLSSILYLTGMAWRIFLFKTAEGERAD